MKHRPGLTPASHTGLPCEAQWPYGSAHTSSSTDLDGGRWRGARLTKKPELPITTTIHRHPTRSTYYTPSTGQVLPMFDLRKHLTVGTITVLISQRKPCGAETAGNWLKSHCEQGSEQTSEPRLGTPKPERLSSGLCGLWATWQQLTCTSPGKTGAGQRMAMLFHSATVKTAIWNRPRPPAA